MKNPIRDIRIEIQRWIFRRKQKRAKAHDADRMAKAIIKANLKSKQANKRLWVVKMTQAEYVILTKQQVRVFFQRLGLRVNYMQTNEYIVHITQKPA
jgi:hypothetical protein